MRVSEEARRLHTSALVIDTHVHPSLKTFLFRKKLHKRHRSGGVIAVIFMNTWLGEHENKNGLDAIVATIRQITVVGGIDSVAIGSDFDGFTDPPDDLKDIAEMPRLTEALLEAGFSETEVEKILGLNMERVLHDGWR